MKECKCGKMPPCYGNLERAIYEEAKMVNDEWKKSRARHYKMIDKLRAKLMEGGFLDDTHDKVYGLNKQMCDIGKAMNDPMKPLSEEAIQEAIKALEITRKPKGIIMEEKKTKKMTKAEAFEWLKGKRVVCDNFNSVAIQRKFFEVGVKWRGGSTDATTDKGRFLFVDLNGCLTHCNSREWFDRHEYEEISADDILSIEIVEEKCELEFNYDKVVELAKPLMHYLNEVGFQDSIRVSQLGIVHEPMSTLIFDPSIGE